MNSECEKALRELQVISEEHKRNLSYPIELPEPAFKLDLHTRKSDKVRMFKHLQQTCLVNVENFRIPNQIKLIYLIDGYLLMTKHENPYGMYSFARSLLELNAFLYEVTKELLVVCEKPENTWLSKGEEFFGLIVRAIYGTSDHPTKKFLKETGVSSRHLEPYNITRCINNLKSDEEHGELAKYYGVLCDHVHHNLSSQATCNQGGRITSTPIIYPGWNMLLTERGTVIKYQYPVKRKAGTAIENTATFTLRNVEAILKWFKRLPSSPFPEKQIIAMTGTHLGVQFIPLAQQNSVKKYGYNGVKKVG